MGSATIAIGKLEQDTMPETTTIEIHDDQREFLKEVSEVSAKRALQILIDNYNEEGVRDIPDARIRELAREEITDNVRMEALE